MRNRRDDTPVINDYTYYVFEEIEKRGLQFAIPPLWRPLYRSFIRERKRRSSAGSYKDDFGSKDATAREENSKANTATRPLEE